MKHFVLMTVVVAALLTLAQQTPAPGSGGVTVIWNDWGSLAGASMNPLRGYQTTPPFSTPWGKGSGDRD